MRFKKFAVATALTGVALFGPTAIHAVQARTIAAQDTTEAAPEAEVATEAAGEVEVEHAAEECIHLLEAGNKAEA